MPPSPAPKLDLKPEDEIKKQLVSLQLALVQDSPLDARARLRDVCNWAVDNGKDVMIDVLNAVPGGSAGVPILKVVLGIAMLRRDARDATAACDELRERLLSIYEQSYELRRHHEHPIDVQMDVIFNKFVAHVEGRKNTSKWLRGIKKASTMDVVNGLKADIVALQQDFSMPALRRIEENVKTLKEAAVPLNSPHPPLPLAPSSFGRDDAVAEVVGLLTTPNSYGATEHVVLVGVGGIGKTTLSQKIVHHPRLKHLGTPTFIRCQRVETLVGFQKELLRLRKESHRDSEDLGDAVQTELHTKPRFLVLDNLFDSPSATPDDFLPYLSLLADIPSVTLLITTRNSDIAGVSSSRRAQRFDVRGLAYGPAELLFRNEFRRDPGSYSLQTNEPDLSDLLRLLGGIPLAIKLVAARARSEPSLQDVVQLWKQGQAWDSGTLALNRQNSVDISLALSFDDKSLEATDTINLLYVLAGLDDPVPSRPAPRIVRLAMEAALRCSLVQSEFDTYDEVYTVRVLEPVRQYILWRRAQLGRPVDVNSPVLRELALHHLMTPLYIASSQGNREEVERLLSAGAVNFDVSLDWGSGTSWRSGGGETPLTAASERGFFEVVDCLLQAGAAVDAMSDSGWTALLLASWKGHIEVVDRLLNAGAGVDVTWDDGMTALHLASWEGTSEVVERLLKAGADPDSKLRLSEMDGGDTPLHKASARGGPTNVEVVDHLLQAGAAVDVKGKCGATPLHRASWNGNYEVVEHLLKAGAAADSKTDGGETPLHQASTRGNHKVVERLLKAGAAADSKTDGGETPLHKASSEGHLKVVEHLLQGGATVDAKGAAGETALHQASLLGHVEVVKHLVQAGTPVNAKTNEGDTALHCASWKGERSTVVLLLTAGADPALKTDKGLLAIDVARSYGYLEVIEELERWSPPLPPVPALPDGGHPAAPINAKNRYTSFFKAKFTKRGGPAQVSGSGGSDRATGAGTS